MKCPVCKKNISQTALKCPYCKSRTGILCSHCNTVNPVGSLKCKQCGQELLKVCPKCGSVNFPSAVKCRKCGTPFGIPKKKIKPIKQKNVLEYTPELYSQQKAVEILEKNLSSEDKKIFSISGEKGVGKTTVLRSVIKKYEEQYQWSIAYCSPISQLTPGGAIHQMLLNLFQLPQFSVKSDDLEHNAVQFFSSEFKFLQPFEISDLFNFIYNFNDGNYEDIIINKKRTFTWLYKIFEAFIATGKYVFVIDNFDFIDGFSVEFLSELIQNDNVWKNIKLIILYNDHKPVSSIFGFENRNLKSFKDIALAPHNKEDVKTIIKLKNKEEFISECEENTIYTKSNGNIAYIEQAINYAFDCQISDKALILPDNFLQLVKSRLDILKKTNAEAYRLLSISAVLGDKINYNLIFEICSIEKQTFDDILSYLVKSGYIRNLNDEFFEFNNTLLWENILNVISKDSGFDDINVKVGKVISAYNLNTEATMITIAHNLRENRMAFDIWTKITRLAAYIGDINLYVIGQKQCLAILNEFSERETVNIRYSISEKLGKLLSEYDPEEALEYLPDAIANARENNDDVKEIELLSYLTQCCSKTGNYLGNVECVDNVLKKLKEGQDLEKALIMSSKLSALLDIGNCGEVINIIDNDILSVLNSYLSKPKLNKMFPLGLLFDTWLKVYLTLATALALQGNNRAFDVLKNLFSIIDKHKINDRLLIARTKIVQAYAYTMKGDFTQSNHILDDIKAHFDNDMDASTVSRWNLVSIINKFMQKDYKNLKETLFEYVTFANNNGDNFTKNILKTLLGKIFKDDNQAQHAIEIYNEQITYFAKEKMALGALLSWYLISEATIVTENSKSAIDIASQALEIAKNPTINNLFFIVNLNMILASAYMNIADYGSAKMYIETALNLAKEFEMYDILSRIYLLYGKYYQDIGSIPSQNQIEYLKGSSSMYEKAMELTVKETKNQSVKSLVTAQKEKLSAYCLANEFKL